MTMVEYAEKIFNDSQMSPPSEPETCYICGIEDGKWRNGAPNPLYLSNKGHYICKCCRREVGEK